MGGWRELGVVYLVRAENGDEGLNRPVGFKAETPSSKFSTASRCCSPREMVWCQQRPLMQSCY